MSRLSPSDGTWSASSAADLPEVVVLDSNVDVDTAAAPSLPDLASHARSIFNCRT